jgi:hypothetical protein
MKTAAGWTIALLACLVLAGCTEKCVECHEKENR